jgi:2-methylisocitrate lyase-like PEP mutase family enzyme
VAVTFLSLHRSERGFVMPNAWDAGSAVVLAAAGFDAIATTSAGVAFSMARPDHGSTTSAQRVPRDEMLERARTIVEAVDVPVNGDLEDGYGVSPEAVAATVAQAIELGLAGANIEDWSNGGLLDERLAVDRIVAAREVIDASGTPFVLTARTDGALLPSAASLASVIARAARLRDAGADCLFTPGVATIDDIATEVRELGAPLNVVLGLAGTLTVPALLDVGVARISLGGTFARAALGFLRDAARELHEHGTIGFADRQVPQGELNALFAR